MDTFPHKFNIASVQIVMFAGSEEYVVGWLIQNIRKGIHVNRY